MTELEQKAILSIAIMAALADGNRTEQERGEIGPPPQVVPKKYSTRGCSASCRDLPYLTDGHSRGGGMIQPIDQAAQNNRTRVARRSRAPGA